MLCIWLSYKKVFYYSNFSRKLDDYEFDKNNKIDNTKKEIVTGDNDLIIEKKSNLFEEKQIDERDKVLFELVIPRIRLRKSVYNIGSSLNNVDKNVEILESSKINKNLFYLASHSGSGDASYFNNLIYLEIGDIIWLYGDNSSLGFVVRDMFYINKNGYFEASYGSDGNVLFLITCSLEYVGKQLIIKADLVYGL